MANNYGATGKASFAEGSRTLAAGDASHAEGYDVMASGNFSHAEGNGTTASGENSHAEGYETTSSGEASHAEGNDTVALNYASHAAGKYNIGTSTETIHETGIGVDNAHRKNAFEIYTDGRIIAPELTNTLINTSKSLVTKEYLEANAGSGGASELEKITEGSHTGWRLLGKDPVNYGDIGQDAVDLSYSDASSTSKGATGSKSTAVGYNTTASGGASYAEGYQTVASGWSSHAEGYMTIASSSYSHAEGMQNEASGYTSHTEGRNTLASGTNSHAEGQEGIASGNNSHAEGIGTKAINAASHAEGSWNTGTATDTIHETGIGSSNGARKNAFEIYTNGRIIAPELTTALITDAKSLVTKEYADSLGGEGGASELEKITEGDNIGWRLLGSDPANYGNIGNNSIDLSHSDAASTSKGATGHKSIATGHNTTASGIVSHAEGYRTVASGWSSHAEGYYTTASGESSHAEGSYTTASGYTSHTEGRDTLASGDQSHAEGYSTVASGHQSHAEGIGTKAINTASHAEGAWNTGTSTDTIHETGIGSSNGARKNAFEIYTDGRVVAPELTTTLINTSRSLVTKEYLEANAGGITQDFLENTARTFTKPQRSSITSEDNDIDFTLSNNFTITATAAVMGTPVCTGCIGQGGVIIIQQAENITGWDARYVFKNVPSDLTNTEVFSYFIETEDIIRIGRMY